MATAASRYYSEDGRASKRQKTDGMDTVSACFKRSSFGAVNICSSSQQLWLPCVDFYRFNYAMANCITMYADTVIVS